MTRLQNNSVASLHSSLVPQQESNSMTRTQNTLKSSTMPNLMTRKAAPARHVPAKQRMGTPVKVKRIGGPSGATGIQTINDDDEEDDEMIKNLTKEIEELRAKRLSHDLYKRSTLEHDDDDDFETAIFAETLLGELGSSSGSHKGDGGAFDELADDCENMDVVDADSGSASARGSRQHPLLP